MSIYVYTPQPGVDAPLLKLEVELALQDLELAALSAIHVALDQNTITIANMHLLDLAQLATIESLLGSSSREQHLRLLARHHVWLSTVHKRTVQCMWSTE